MKGSETLFNLCTVKLLHQAFQGTVHPKIKSN